MIILFKTRDIEIKDWKRGVGKDKCYVRTSDENVHFGLPLNVFLLNWGVAGRSWTSNFVDQDNHKSHYDASDTIRTRSQVA